MKTIVVVKNRFEGEEDLSKLVLELLLVIFAARDS